MTPLILRPMASPVGNFAEPVVFTHVDLIFPRTEYRLLVPEAWMQSTEDPITELFRAAFRALTKQQQAKIVYALEHLYSHEPSYHGHLQEQVFREDVP